jgi:hypothetical protein
MNAPRPAPDTPAPSPVPAPWVVPPGLRVPRVVLDPRPPSKTDQGLACGLCRALIGRGSDPQGPTPCERCGDVFHERCFWRMAAFGERVTLECSDAPHLFVCWRCRS